MLSNEMNDTEGEVFDEAVLREFKEAFKMFDSDGSGDIDINELGAVFA